MVGPHALAFATYAYGLAALTTIAGILTAALAIQYLGGELPCPLCLLERAALFGAAFGLMMNLTGRYSSRYTGLMLIFALFLLIVATRQTLLDIYPRPGHVYVGSAVLGLHMPVWSVLISVALIGANALKLALLGGDAHMHAVDPESFPRLHAAGRVLGLYVVLLAAVNLVSALVQCGFGQCHTAGYALLP